MTLLSNLHATAIVIGTRGILFLGPSGAGKSMLALACIDAARQAGQFSALIADDQVFLENANGCTIVKRPPATAGLLEIRHSGIVSLASVDAAVLHMAVRIVERNDAERMPPAFETYSLPSGLELPLIRVAADALAPLAVLAALAPDFAR
ncbi:HPr kinase/phosphorylase [Neorhizobium sp. JUb45]|uniref:HPr kinase/phosphorylase n=1 Tax=unclassified Neorhizobium TaxID=2629175 RepID=UPI001044CFC5|nr:HPr kinase/phosphorylase [Neorhizobium sp. JUb45]TCQ99622.1 Hpr(Ser) kinase/phosphatase [Neorhizobium sp. JUb45]